MQNNINKIKNIFLIYIIYLFPLFLIIGNAVLNSALFLVLFIYLMNCISEKKLIYFDRFEFKVFLIFYIYLIFNSLIANEILPSILRSASYIKYFIFVLVYLELFEERKINIFKLGIIWISILTLLNLDIIFQSIMGYDIFGYVSKNPERNSGFFFDELVAGGFITGLSFITIQLIKNSKINNLTVYSFLFFCLICCIISGERSNTIKFIIIFFSIPFILKDFFLKKTHKYFLIFILLLLTPFLYFNKENLKNRYLNEITLSIDKDLGLVDKYFTSLYGSHTLSAYFILKDNLYFGVGNKNFRFLCSKYESDVNKFQRQIDNNLRFDLPSCTTHPHQLYNEFLSEHGLIGSLIILTLILIIIVNRIRSSNLSNLNLVSLLYLITVFTPILPSGSFFTSYTSALFWLNFLFFLVSVKHK